MKKLALLCIGACLSLGIAIANPMPPLPFQEALEGPGWGQRPRQTRITPSYSFSRTPFALMTNYYDYMIGSYNSLPLRAIPASAGGGYFMTYHGRRTPTGTRRVYYSYIDANGDLINNNEITAMINNEGYPALAVDPVSGKPMYAWHSNADADVDFEVEFASDAFFYGISGLFNERQIVINNPSTVIPPNGSPTMDNEFIWPSMQIGPSPIANKRRVYVLARNSVSHSYGPVENAKIAYADFDANMIEMGDPLVWSYTSIPEMDDWNHATQWRRPFHSLAVDQLGNLYYAGYHNATEADGMTYIDEADFDVFVCGNFGAGTWSRASEYSHIPSWNPPASPGGAGFFVDTGSVPYPDNQLVWKLANSGHLNAVTDIQGRVIVPGLWAQSIATGSYWPNFHTVKCMIFDPVTNSFNIKDIYPQKHPTDNFNQTYTPWDTQSPWGVPEYYMDDTGNFVLRPEVIFPFPHWDRELHTDAMMFHYNNIKVSEVNDEGMMVAVWQDSYRAKQANELSDPEFMAYSQTPEIYLAVSSDQGDSWSAPIILNNVETPLFSNIKPMWVYPADEVKFMGMQGLDKIGRIGLMFYNDYTWGANAIAPAAHPTNDGGQVMFTELEIVFPASTILPQDPFGNPVVLSSSMTMMAGVMINDQMASDGDVLAAFVNVNGMPQLRGKETIQIDAESAGCLLQIYTESDDENVYFKVWDASSGNVLSVAESIPSVINGSIGSWPDDLYWLHAYHAQVQSIALQNGWNLFSLNVHPDAMAIPSIFAAIHANVEYLKSPDGLYEPGNPYNTLTELEDGGGYLVKMTAPTVLNVQGLPVAVDTALPLDEGWNLVGYTPQAAMAVDMAIASISSHLIQVKGYEGVYEPDNPYSTLSTLTPGRAYWMKLYSPANLLYPADGRYMLNVSSEEAIPENLILKSNSQSVLLGFDDAAAAGDIVQAWVGDELRGSAIVKAIDGQLGALLQVYTELNGETVEFRLQKAASANSVVLQPGLHTTPGSIIGDYAAGIYYTLQQGQPDVPELITALGKAYPNPFSRDTSILLSVAKDVDQLRVEIYNVRGQKVRTLLSGSVKSGAMNLTWDGCDDAGRQMPSGVYFCRLQDSKTNQSRKLMLLK